MTRASIAVFILLVLTAPAAAGSLASLAKEQGNGSRFKMQVQGSAYDLQVGLVKVDQGAGLVTVEVFAASQLADPLWQQFTLSARGDRLQVEAGYIQMGSHAPMKLQANHLAGTVACDHYRLERPEQHLEFWISDKASPIGLVRLISAGKKLTDNYRLELEELLSGIAAKIDPGKAVPLSDEMKALLDRP